MKDEKPEVDVTGENKNKCQSGQLNLEEMLHSDLCDEEKEGEEFFCPEADLEEDDGKNIPFTSSSSQNGGNEICEKEGALVVAQLLQQSYSEAVKKVNSEVNENDSDGFVLQLNKRNFRVSKEKSKPRAGIKPIIGTVKVVNKTELGAVTKIKWIFISRFDTNTKKEAVG